MMNEWIPYHNGFVKGNIGIFPSWFGAWQVHQKINGEWEEVRNLWVEADGRDYNPNGNPPYSFWTRTREEVIAMTKLLAENFETGNGLNEAFLETLERGEYINDDFLNTHSMAWKVNVADDYEGAEPIWIMYDNPNEADKAAYDHETSAIAFYKND